MRVNGHGTGRSRQQENTEILQEVLDLNSSLRADNFADGSSSLTFTGMRLMPLSCRASMNGSAAFKVFATCPLLPVTITGRVEPLRAPKVTSLSFPIFTCKSLINASC